jgi:hypothetical protein
LDRRHSSTLGRADYTDTQVTDDSGPPIRVYPAILTILPIVTTYVGIYRLHSGWAAILAYHIVIVFGLLFNRNTLTVRWVSGRWNALAVACCAASAAAGPVLFAVLPAITVRPVQPQLEALGLTGLSWMLFIPYFALVNPVLEEAFWRGTPHSTGRAFCSDVMFASYHLLVLPFFIKLWLVVVAAVLLVCVSAVWRHVTRQCGSMLPAIIAHCLADTGIVLAIAFRR